MEGEIIRNGHKRISEPLLAELERRDIVEIASFRADQIPYSDNAEEVSSVINALRLKDDPSPAGQCIGNSIQVFIRQFGVRPDKILVMLDENALRDESDDKRIASVFTTLAFHSRENFEKVLGAYSSTFEDRMRMPTTKLRKKQPRLVWENLYAITIGPSEYTYKSTLKQKDEHVQIFDLVEGERNRLAHKVKIYVETVVIKKHSDL